MARFALLTPPEPSALAVFRLRGELGDLAGHLRGRRGLLAPARLPQGKPRRTRVLGVDGALLDDGLLLRTGAEEWELHCHGGLAVIAGLRALFLACGLDEEAPPLPVIARAGSRYALAAALWQPRAWEEERAACAALPPAGQRRRLGRLQARRGWAAALFGRPRVVLLGAPNAGKSTLFNRLCLAERALVSDTAGTTRDLLRSPAVVGPLAVELQDGAGLRATGDRLEAAGIARVLASVEGAAACVHVLDGSAAPARAWRELHRPLRERLRLPALVVVNKADAVPRHARTPRLDGARVHGGVLWLSAASGAGLPRFARALARLFGFRPAPAAALPVEEAQRRWLRDRRDELRRGPASAEGAGRPDRAGPQS